MSRHVDPRFGRRMRELLRARGMSYRTLAAKTYYGKSHLNDLANGYLHPTPECAARIDAALEAEGDLVRLICPPTTGQPDAREPVDAGVLASETGDVLRRAVLTALAGLGLGQLVDERTVAGLVAALGQRQGDNATAADWQETAWEYGYAYFSMVRGDLLRDVTADLAQVQALLPAARGAGRADLSEAAARLAGLMAMACTDLGYDREARHGWRLARRYAEASGSADCQLWVRGQEATLGLYSRRPAPVVLALADRGLALGAADVGGRAELLAARAQTLSLLGRPDEAEAALKPLRDAFDALPDSVTTCTDSIFGWPEHRLRHTESIVHTGSGTSVQAHRAHDAALALYPPARLVSRCQIKLHRAARLVRDGHIGDGLSYAGDSLAALPAEHRGRLVLTVAEQVLEAVPAGETQRPEAAELRDRLVAETA
jgi:hypothetical protein